MMYLSHFWKTPSNKVLIGTFCYVLKIYRGHFITKTSQPKQFTCAKMLDGHVFSSHPSPRPLTSGGGGAECKKAMCKQDFVSCMMCWSTGGPERFGSSPELRSCSSLEELQRSQKKNHPGSIGQRAKPPSLEVLDRKLDERMATAREHHLMSLRYGPCLPPSQCSILRLFWPHFIN